jgi:DNA repair ATPase RecN
MSKHRIGRVSDNASKNRALAEAVLEKYAEEYEEHGAEWAKKYLEDINKFINDPMKFQGAVDKLSTWYNVLDEYKGEIKRAYSQIREEYADALARKYRERIEKLQAEAEKTEKRSVYV